MDWFSVDDNDEDIGNHTTMGDGETTTGYSLNVTTSLSVLVGNATAASSKYRDVHIIVPAYVQLGIFAFFCYLLLFVVICVAIAVASCYQCDEFECACNRPLEELPEREFYGSFFFRWEDSDDEGEDNWEVHHRSRRYGLMKAPEGDGTDGSKEPV
jgi:hypothetical protein